MREAIWMRQDVQLGSMIAAIVSLITIIALTLVDALSVAPILPSHQIWERLRWEQRKPRHYELDIVWSSGSSGGSERVEIRDDQIVRIVDLKTGQSLGYDKAFGAHAFGSIDKLFALIDTLNWPVLDWKQLLARAYPSLARQIDPCLAPAAQLQYDPIWGYPTEVRWYAGPCAPGFNLRVQVRQLRQLP